MRCRPGLTPSRLAAATVALLLAGCGPSASAPAPVTAPETARAAQSANGPRRVVLVEADGPGPELEAYLSRLQSDLSDSGTLPLVDARLSGATLGSLASDPGAPATKTFLETWPGSLLLAVSLAPCGRSVSTTQIPDTTPEGYKVYRQIVNVTTSCKVTVRAADPSTGQSRLNESIEGTSGMRVESEGEETPELEAVRKAASRTAKRLTGLKH